jgi:hypothetical protein
LITEDFACSFDHLSPGGFHSADAEREMTTLGNVSMSPGRITALAAIFGSLVGALGSSVSTWITQRHQDRRDLLARKIFHRQQLYSDFISESARLRAHCFACRARISEA